MVDSDPAARRRKIRRGTRSCWECKRRKNRCTWSLSHDGKDNNDTAAPTSCDACRRRGTRCVGQEFPEEGTQRHRSGNGRVADGARLERIESLVEELVRKVGAGNVNVNVNVNGQGWSDEALALIGDGMDRDVVLVEEGPPANSFGDDDGCVYKSGNEIMGNGAMRISNAEQQTPISRMVPGSSLGQFGGQLSSLTHALVAAWPSGRHHDAILNSDAGFLHPAMSSPCSGFRTPPSPRDLLRLPPPGTAPVDIARKLLTLGTYLQVVSSQSEGDYRDVVTRVFGTVGRLVTHNDELPGSVDIVECLITESQFHNYQGNIKRSWITLRRAVAMAQMIGLDQHSPPKKSTSKFDTATSSSRQEHIWFLLVHLDQYLSLILGITPGTNQTATGALETCTPAGRMGRLHSLAAGRILRRNHIDIYDRKETKQIDGILRRASACMAAQWWSCPPDTDVDRLMVQFAHWNILLQLHLPFVLRRLTTTSGLEDVYSTTTVINASREMLIRFTAFRRKYPRVSYCCGLDFFAFVAAAALCLLHIADASACGSHDSDTNNEEDGSVGFAGLLAHQRLAHRGLVESALECIEKIAKVKTGEKMIVEDILPVFRSLVKVEEKASRGVGYSIVSLGRKGMGATELMHDGLYLELPFSGTLKVERAVVSGVDVLNLAGIEMRMSLSATCESHPPAIAGSYHFDKELSGGISPETFTSAFSGGLAMSYDTALDVAPIQGLLEPEMMDPSFFDGLFDG